MRIVYNQTRISMAAFVPWPQISFRGIEDIDFHILLFGDYEILQNYFYKMSTFISIFIL